MTVALRKVVQAFVNAEVTGWKTGTTPSLTMATQAAVVKGHRQILATLQNCYAIHTFFNMSRIS